MSSPGNEPVCESTRFDRTGQAEAFDAIGNRYDEVFPHKQGQIEASEWLARSLPAGSRVLDVGCGTGVPTSRRLAQAGFEVVGIDLSGVMVDLARRHVPAAVFHQADIADLRPSGPLDLGRFDAVTAFFSLLMLPRAEIPLALRTIRHLLVPGGQFLLAMVEADLDDCSIPFIGKTIRVSAYPRVDLHEVVEGAGFEIAEEICYAYAPASSDAPPEEQIFLRCRARSA
ncbi:class I SAM-dependent methyltransferase [Streptomyces sp. NPDC002867]